MVFILISFIETRAQDRVKLRNIPSLFLAYIYFRSKRKPASETKNLVYKILSAPLSFAIPEDFEVIRDMLVDIARYARTLETQMNQLQPLDKSSSASSASPPVIPESNHESDVEDKGEGINVVDSLANRVNNIGLGKFGRRHVTRRSQSILQTALDIRDEVNGAESRVMSKQQQRAEFWSLSPVNQLLPYLSASIDHHCCSGTRYTSLKTPNTFTLKVCILFAYGTIFMEPRPR